MLVIFQMDPNNNVHHHSVSTVHPRGNPHDGGLLPASNALGPQHALPTYPSSTLQYYYPSSYHATNYTMHIVPIPTPFPSHTSVPNNFTQMPLPSASQSHIPSLRHTPSFSSPEIINVPRTFASPLLDQ
jgi:hypothetical protein